MPNPSPRELKKTLIREGFEIYRTLEDCVVLAERVRDNLIMDSGVAARAGDPPAVRVVLRAQANDFPGEGPEELVRRARKLAAALTSRGYSEVLSQTVPIFDPGDRSRTLDTWYEVSVERAVSETEELVEELRFAMQLDKTVPGPGAQ
jgi:hypothetical protein